MVLTKAHKKQMLAHVLDVIFDEDADSDMRKVIEYNKFRSTHDIITMNDEDFASLLFQDDQNKMVDISKSDAGLLRMFKAFVAYRNITNNPIQDNDWLNLTKKNLMTSVSALLVYLLPHLLLPLLHVLLPKPQWI